MVTVADDSVTDLIQALENTNEDNNNGNDNNNVNNNNVSDHNNNNNDDIISGNNQQIAQTPKPYAITLESIKNRRF